MTQVPMASIEEEASKTEELVTAKEPATSAREEPLPQYSVLSRISAALLYAVTSFFILIVNKHVLTTYRFPSFLALGIGQMLDSIILLFAGKIVGLFKLPSPSLNIFTQVWPLPLLSFGFAVFGLGGTQKASLPMFVVLRRLSNVFIMIGEYVLLGVVASFFVQFTVFLMVLGTIVAAINDLSFDQFGYVYIMCANICSSAGGVYTKKKLNLQILDKNGLIFYNNLLMLLPAFYLAYYMGDVDKALTFPEWENRMFQFHFLLACLLGFVVNYTTVLCTQYNSALTTSIVGVIKNLVVTYVGMSVGGDYRFSIFNFIGINISVIGGLMYSYATFRSKSQPPPTPISEVTSV